MGDASVTVLVIGLAMAGGVVVSALSAAKAAHRPLAALTLVLIGDERSICSMCASDG